jgi:hypothetical protein
MLTRNALMILRISLMRLSMARSLGWTSSIRTKHEQ